MQFSNEKSYVSFILTNIFLIIFVTFFFNGSCHAENSSQDEQLSKQKFDTFLSYAGITAEKSGQNLDIIINQHKALSAIPSLQKMGVLANNISQSEINLKPTMMAIDVVGMFFVSIIVEFYYKTNNDLDSLHINGYLIAPDEFGNEIKRSCFSFDFNRSIYERVNWDTFLFPNILKVSDNFTLSDWCTAKFNGENRINIQLQP